MSKGFKEILKDLRLSCDLTQAQVAEACGITEGAYNHIETGRRTAVIDVKIWLGFQKVFKLSWTETMRLRGHLIAENSLDNDKPKKG